MFQYLKLLLLVPEVKDVVCCYTSKLLEHLCHSLPERFPYGWTSLYLEDVKIMMFAASKSTRQWSTDSIVVSETPSNLIMYTYVGNTPGLYDKVRTKVQVVMVTVNQPHGILEFVGREPFGYGLVFSGRFLAGSLLQRSTFILCSQV